MELTAWLIVAFLAGAVFGLTWPRLCTHCKMERKWIERTLNEFRKIPHGDKLSKPS